MNEEEKTIVEPEVEQAEPFVEDINMYDFNKVNMAQIEPLDIIYLKKRCIEAMENIAIGSYWMLLNRELHDYTVFVNNGEITNVADKGEVLFQTLGARGKVVDFTKRADDAWEIWVRIPIFNPQTNQESTTDVVYYFFNYDIGIVEV